MRSELALFGPEATRRFLGALYRSAPARSFVEVRFRMASGMGQCFHRAAALDRAAETILALASRTDVFVGVLPRARRGGGRRDLVARAAVVWADCDTWAAVEALASFRPRPAMVVGSGIIRSARVQRGCGRAVRCWRHVVSEADWVARGGGRDGR